MAHQGKLLSILFNVANFLNRIPHFFKKKNIWLFKNHCELVFPRREKFHFIWYHIHFFWTAYLSNSFPSDMCGCSAHLKGPANGPFCGWSSRGYGNNPFGRPRFFLPSRHDVGEIPDQISVQRGDVPVIRNWLHYFIIFWSGHLFCTTFYVFFRPPINSPVNWSLFCNPLGPRKFMQLQRRAQ